MSNSTISIGIDFGTTNSVVAALSQNRAQPLRNIDGRDITPSVVGINERGEVLIGDGAVNFSKLHPEDVRSGFKRNIGSANLPSEYFPLSKSSYTPEELSSFILKDLLHTAALFLGENPRSAVITVPANFGEPQKAALIEIGNNAGLEQVSLVQEPVAAGLAYGWDTEINKPFLVFDIGGGTFDLALVEIVEKQLIVRAQKGVKTLGGRDIDAKILDSIVIPRLQAEIDHQSLEERRHLLQKECEEAKIKLSRIGSVDLQIANAGLKDSAGNEIQEIITISRADIDPIILQITEQTLDPIKQVLNEANLSEQELAAILMVGGPTRSPAMRDLLTRELDIALETSIDPLSVVAQGAAYQAASIPQIELAPRVVSESTVALRLEFEPIANDVSCTVGIALVSPDQVKDAKVRLRRSDAGWESGWIDLSAGSGIANVIINEKGDSVFNLELTSGTGELIQSLEPSSLTIMHGISAANPPLSLPIGVIVEDFADGSELSMAFFAQKGEATPLTRKQTFRTTKTLVAGEKANGLEVHFRQGESNLPFRNQPIGSVRINGSDIERTLDSGGQVEVTLRISPDSSAKASVYIPALDKTFDNKLELDKDSVSDQDLSIRLENETQRLRDLNERNQGTEKALGFAAAANTELAKAEAGDSDSRARAASTIEKLELEIDQINEQMGPALLLDQLNDEAAQASRIVEQFGDEKDQQRLNDLNHRLDNIDKTNISAVQAITNHFIQLNTDILIKQPGFWVHHFDYLVNSGIASSSQYAAELVKQGEKAVKDGNYGRLRSIVHELIDFRKEDDPLISGYGGIRKDT